MVDRSKPEQFVDAFEDLVNFVHRKPKASVATLIALLLTLGVLLISYRVYVKIGELEIHTDKNTTQLQQINPSPDEMQRLLRESSANNISINAVLRRVLEVGGDRVYVMKFHNGTRDINGMHFLYVSTTNEITKPGISNVMSQVQDIQTSMFDTKWIEKFLKNECVGIKVAELDKGMPMQNLMSKLGIAQMQICPIYDVQKGYLLGLAGVSWVQSEPSKEVDDKTDEALVDINLALSSLLTPAEILGSKYLGTEGK